MYLLYPTLVGGYAIFLIPVGQTATSLATSFGLTMAECAEFDMASFDPGAINFQYRFTLIDNQPLANGVALPLVSVKEQASQITKSKYSEEQQSSLRGYSAETLAAQATLPELSRIPAVQEVITQVNVLAVQLEAELTAIDLATSVTEVSNIAYPPTGVINIGRGQFGGPYDLNASNYITFNSTSLAQSETELYAPVTSSTVPYQGFPPDDFNSSGPIFVEGDYLIQIRETATGTVIAEFDVPLSLDGTNVDIAFNASPYPLPPTPPTPPPANTFNVTNNGSGNYVINGASNPTLTLAGGITYTFNISAPGHPFWIKTTQTTGTGDQYNTGVTNNGTDNGVITFVAPLTVEDFTLYYNCQYHSSMAGVLNMVP